MIITREYSKHGNYCPAAVDILGQVPSCAIFNVAHKLRHPESIYKLSLEKVGAAFCEVAAAYLDKTEKCALSENSETVDIAELLTSLHKFLHALQEHVDELWLVMKTLVDPSVSPSTSIFAERYVTESKLAGAKSFAQAIRPYKAALRIVNKLKHQQGQLRGVVMRTTNGPHFGYFIEEPDEQGVLGPSPEIHPDQKAFSFARELPWHLANIYMCSEKLADAVERALKAKAIIVRSSPSPGLLCWERVIELARTLPEAFFPADIRRGIVLLAFDETSKSLTLRLPRRVQPRIPYIIKVGCTFKIDGHSPTFKTPLV